MPVSGGVRPLAVLILIAGLAFAFAVPAAEAGTGEASQAPSAEVGAASQEARGGLGSLWGRAILYVRSQQRELHRELAGAIKALRNEGSVTAAWSLILLSFLYGVFQIDQFISCLPHLESSIQLCLNILGLSLFQLDLLVLKFSVKFRPVKIGDPFAFFYYSSFRYNVINGNIIYPEFTQSGRPLYFHRVFCFKLSGCSDVNNKFP